MQIETNRLYLRQWNEDDFEFLTAFFSDEDQTRFIGGTKNQEEAWRLMATYIGHYHLRKYSYQALVEKKSGQLIGSVGLWNSEPWPELELGYWLSKEKQGMGYASEAAGAVRDYAFRELKVKTLVSFINSRNSASIKLALKLGAVYEKDVPLLSFGLHGVYRYRADFV